MADAPDQPDQPPAETPREGRWRLVTMLPNDGQEPPFELSEDLARTYWAGVSAPWHPALLADSADLPRIEDVDYPTHPDRDELRFLVKGPASEPPSGYDTQAADIGAVLIEAIPDRAALIERAHAALGATVPIEFDPIALDFLALGLARWWLRDLIIGMGHADVTDLDSLRREALAGARAWRDGDRAGARNRLRAAFELLTQARERVYPVDAYVLGLCLLAPNVAPHVIDEELDAQAPVTFLAPARAIQALAENAPDAIARLRAAINDGWADVIGGPYGEADEPLRPIESILWQLRKGHETYRAHLDDRAVETFARRRFGLFPQLPQVAKRFGFRFALHLGLDDGAFPVPPESKRLWEAPDGSHLESLTRVPIAGHDPIEGTRIAWRLAKSMKDDHVATLPVAHWPGRVADWFRDLRRVAAYSPVLARWVTANDYFHLSDRPWEMMRPELDEYVTPYLEQAVARGDAAPISRRVRQSSLRAQVDALHALSAIARCLSNEAPPDFLDEMVRNAHAAEDAVESGRFDEAQRELEDRWSPRVAANVLPAGPGRSGYLVLNPAGIARRAPVLLPDAAPDLRPEGPLRAAQFTDEGVWAIVELPAFGFAWVPKAPSSYDAPPNIGALGVRGRTLFNELMEVEIDERTGGIRGLRASGEPAARLGQMLVVPGLDGAMPGRMVAESIDIDYGGPALVQAVTRGTLRDPASDRVLYRFRQRYRLWSGRPLLEIAIALTDEPSPDSGPLLAGSPWARYLACRWAWPDPEADLRRTSLLAPELTRADRPESPDLIDISTRRQRTALIFGGLAHHKRIGARMLDTLLLAGNESHRGPFNLCVALDQEYPFTMAIDRLAPVFAIPTESGPPAIGPSGWFFHLDAPGIAITRVEPIEHSGDGRGWGLAFHLLETTGRASRCRLRLPWRPSWARQTDFNGDAIVDLPIDEDAVAIDLTPHELARIDVTMG